MSGFGPQLERLLAVAASARLIAAGGRRDGEGVVTSSISLVPRGKGKARSLPLGAACGALGFVGDDLLIAGAADGSLVAWDVSGEDAVKHVELSLGAGVRGLAIDGARAAAVTVDGAVHLLAITVREARPNIVVVSRDAVAERALDAVTFEGSSLVVGGADGVWVLESGGVRHLAMGGEGGARALVGLGDGRVVAGFGDGSLRVGYIAGEVEAVDRSGEHAHGGAVRGLVLGPALFDAAGREQPRRLWSLGEDGLLASWPLDSARRPRTVEVGAGPGAALAVVTGTVKGTESSTAQVIVATAARKLAVLTLGAEGEPVGNVAVTGSELDRLAADLDDHKPKSQSVRATAIDALAAIPEDDARGLLDRALSRDPVHDLRAAAAKAIGLGNRRLSRPAIRKALADGQAAVRAAAFTALRELEKGDPLVAIRAGLDASAEDVRLLALDALRAQPPGPLTASLAADRFTDGAATVRERAFAVARVLGAADARWAVRTALARGPADLRARALFTLGLVDRADDAAARGLVAAALDDGSPDVRWAAYAVALCARPRTAGRLRALDSTLAANLIDAAARVGVAEGALPPVTPQRDGDPALLDDDRAPLFQAMACRQPETALRGARGLIHLGDARALGALLGLSRDADAGVRRAAVDALAVAATSLPDDDRALARLAWLCDDADPQVRAAAVAALVARTGGEAGAELDLAETTLRASQEDVRTRVLALLIKHGPAGPHAARADALLGDALDDEAAKVRNEAYKTLWAWHASTPMVPLERAARCRHADLRGQVVAELARRREAKQGSAAGEAVLVALARDPVAEVGLAAYAALTKEDADKARPEAHLAAMASPRATVRAAGAAGARHAPASAVRARLVELVRDDQPVVHTAAIESLDKVAPSDAEGFALAFASIFYALQIRAGELCGTRRDKRAVAPMQRLLSVPKTEIDRPGEELRRRAARALADVGDVAAVPFLSALLDDDDALVREFAARGLATACGHPQQQALLDALGHADLPVRSWAAEGLARLGDLRALPVLAGTQRHDHRPLRLGAIAGLTALGADGARGLRQALEDAEREVQDLAFAVIVARDVALASRGIEPDLLLDALAGPSAELRFAAARLIEARAAGADLLTVATELVGPRKPEKAADMKEWPAEARRAAILRVVVDTLASDESGRRYAAAQVLMLRPQPLAFWREAQRLSGPAQTTVPSTNWATEDRSERKTGWIRRLVVGRAREAERAAGAVDAPSELERLLEVLMVVGGTEPGELPPRPPSSGGLDASVAARLVFGVYAGLVRQGAQGGTGVADETQRVRRDAVDRIAALAADGAIGRDAALPVMEHALADSHHLVRLAAMTAVRAQYPRGALAPLAAALRSAADIGRAAIDELVALAMSGPVDGRSAAAELVHSALDADDKEVREHAFLRLARLYPAGSVAPLLAGARSRHADVRGSAVTMLVERSAEGAGDADAGPVLEALASALTSDDADLRFGAASGLARRGDPRAVDVLGGFLRDEERVEEALEALITASGRAPSIAGAAALVVAARVLDDPDRTAPIGALLEGLGQIAHEAAAPVLLQVIAAPVAEGQADHWSDERVTAMVSLLQVARDRTRRPARLPDGRERARYRESLLLPWLAEAARAIDPLRRIEVAKALGDVDAAAAEEQLERLLTDRDPTVRVAACEALALRVAFVPGATLGPLEAALRGGRRELVLPAGEGLARRGRPEAFFALLLVLKAGEPPERERAALALGELGDRRALEHLVPLLDAGPDAPQDRAVAPAAIEGLGAMIRVLVAKQASVAPAGDEPPAETVAEEIAGLRERIERTAVAGVGAERIRALAALRRIGDDRSRALLERVMLDRELPEPERTAAADELGRLADPASEAALGAALRSEIHRLRAAAARAAALVFASDRTRAHLLALPSAWPDVAGPAADYLAQHGDPQTIVAGLGELDDAVRRSLREGLVRRRAFPVGAISAALDEVDARARIEGGWLAGASADPSLAAAVTRAIGQIGRAHV